MKYTNSKDATKEAIEYIQSRRTGKVEPVMTPFMKLNEHLGGGFEWGEIITIAGMSGSGKSIFLSLLETKFALMPNTEILSFNLEMRAHKIMMRKLSNKLRIPIKNLFDPKVGLPKSITESALKEIANQPISYDEHSTSVDDIIKSTVQFIRDKNIIKRKANMIVTIDYASLIDYDNEKLELITLMKQINRLKKLYPKFLFVILSQLNRNIEHPARRSEQNLTLHYPIKSDIYGTDALFNTSDVVIVIHNPFALGIDYYGPQQIDAKDMIFLHVIKGRNVGTSILAFKNELKYNNLAHTEISTGKPTKLGDFKNIKI